MVAEEQRVITLQAFLLAPHIKAIVVTFAIMHPDLPDMDDNRLLEVAIAGAVVLQCHPRGLTD